MELGPSSRRAFLKADSKLVLYSGNLDVWTWPKRDEPSFSMCFFNVYTSDTLI